METDESGSALPVLKDDRRRERRAKVREMCRLLESDLYQRTGGQWGSAIWTSPLNLTCEYGYDEAAEGYQPVWCELRDSHGVVYARSEDADRYWLDGAML
jgi:hypothetical protein